MADSWQLCDSDQGRLLSANAIDLDAALQTEGEQVSGGKDSTCRVFRRQIGGQVFYFKIYQANEFQLRNFFGASKLQTEWRNLLFFHQLGLNIPEPVVIGERRRLGVFQAGVLVSAEIPTAIDLAALAESRPELLADRGWFGELCQALGGPLRMLHQHHFAHNDLNWRNVLLTLEPTLKVYFFDCPTGRRWPRPFLGFRIIKDLTHLDKLGRRYLSRSQRLRFYLAYAGRKRLEPSDKALIAKVLGRKVARKYQGA